MKVEDYKKIIDDDFKRFVQLEKSWIINISHKIMPSKEGMFIHDDRKELRDELIKYLNSKTKTKQNKNLIWKKKRK